MNNTALDTLHARRLGQWGQTPRARVADPEAAARLIERVGIATLFPASPEFPNLFHAYVGDPEARTDSGHDTPSGEVYGWRWALGKRDAAFYTAIVRDRPTWVGWPLLPAVLRLRGELRPPEELYKAGELSVDALRIARALRGAGGALNTGELREAAGFPTGKPQRAAYLKAVAELDTRLILAKVFSADEGDLDMRHALVAARHPAQVAAAGRMSREEALERVLRVYLPAAVYAVPAPLARGLKIPERELLAALDRLVEAGAATAAPFPGQKGTCYLWREG
ncbi:MAG: hypothetical protein M3Q65_22375 [Chloroflexota bacterium]|nr:hypothetical protein [Chloroflexota bacterium]